MGKGFYSDGRPWPKLSETLTGPKRYGTCQRCGSTDSVCCWRECDDKDDPTDVVLFLCTPCSDHVIERHPRLYGDGPHRNAPIPGAMACCLDCIHHHDLSCKSPLLKANGGAGLPISASKPTVIHVDGRTKGGKRFGRWYEDYPSPPECKGREAAMKIQNLLGGEDVT